MTQPLFFYKFVSFARKDILTNGMIRFAPIGSFNDPFELEPSITPYSKKFLQYINEISERNHKKITMTEADYVYSAERVDSIEYYRDKYRAEVGKYGVLSLSSNDTINQLLTVSMPERKDPRTNILMWSHYADSHKGFVIEFRADFVEGVKLEKVEYSDFRHVVTFEDIDENNFDNIFFRKSSDWEYEQEYRAVLPLSNASEIHDERFHLYKINKSSINSITFGCAMSEEEKKIIMDIVKKDPEFKGVKMQHARLDEKGFFLDFYYDDGRWTNKPFFVSREIPNQIKM
ncbi:DUF2971 domain-containing protein [Pseudomonas moraviensis]|uniref:DUF2971 domain-containing protein n=1 Tax=Pseudomonas moraviensis TaxID=321662 RepID=UPI00080E5096|nr:DUF2971 domain-containing protein [Pseudomonas moraviensis]